MPNSLNVLVSVFIMFPHLFHEIGGLFAGSIPAEIMEIDMVHYT